MRRRLNPWVVLLSAALTFGSLMAFVGPRSFGHFRDYRYGPKSFWDHPDHRGYGHHGYGRCDDADQPDARLRDSRAGEKSTGSDTSSIQ